MPLSAGDRIGAYEIVALLGAGGMGEVYRARDAKLKRDVAIKVLPDMFAGDPERMARFQREAEVLASLNHPNIAQIYGIEERAIVMEMVEGENLEGPLPIDTALEYFKQIADALEAAHEKGIVHRDLKPANIKVTPQGVVKVLDFGLAAVLQASASRAGNASNSPTLTMGATQAGMIMGTASYMSPEQAAGKPADKRADIWSFGVVLYEMLTGQRLFEGGETISHTLADVLRAPIDLTTLPRETPESIRGLLQRCLDRDVKNRLRDIGEARVSISRAGQDIPLPAERAPERSRLHLAAWIAAGVFAIGLASLGFLHFRGTAPAEHTLRYTIPTPDGGSLHSFAVSPNGREVVAAIRVKGRLDLWLRSMDALQWQLMPTTENAAYPFWSPDSRNVAFFVQGQLRRIAASGGPSQPVCPAAAGRGGTWNRDDVILFSPSFSDNMIKRVPAAGGVPTDVLKDKKTPKQYPAFLPDGRHFLYLATGGSPEYNGIYAASLDGTENRRIVPDNSGFAFAPPSPRGRIGHLFFLRENNLMAQPLDAGSAQISGEVFPVAEGVGAAQNVYAPVSVSDNGILFYWAGGTAGGAASFDPVWYDRSGKVKVEGPASNIIMPAISPDERMIAFSKGATGGSRDIWVRDLIRGNERRLTTDASQNVTPFWSPKTGERIVYRSNRNGHTGDIYTRTMSGAGQDELVLSTINGKVVDQWATGFIVYHENDPKTKDDLWYLPVDAAGKPSGKPMPFLHSDFNELHGQLSSDGRWMAYTSDVAGQREVYVQPFPSADNEIRVSTNGGEQPRWRGDGKELFYQAADGKINAVAVTVIAGSKTSLQFGPPVPLFDAHSSAGSNAFFNYDVTADGKRFLVSAVGATSAQASASSPLTVRVNWIPNLSQR
jgi:eukaryotic-like serine/threonine-protein kinase